MFWQQAEDLLCWLLHGPSGRNLEPLSWRIALTTTLITASFEVCSATAVCVGNMKRFISDDIEVSAPRVESAPVCGQAEMRTRLASLALRKRTRDEFT